jgi:hypothetical protein
MPQVATQIYLYARVQDASGNPVAGLTKASFTIVFLRNNAACTDFLNVIDMTGGLYSIGYIPTTAGIDYVDIFEPITKCRTVSTYTVRPLTGLASLTSIVTGLPTGILSPENYVLSIYLDSDWINGNRGVAYAKGQTGLNSDGTWKHSIPVLSGTYTIVLRNTTTTIVLAPNYTV